MSIVIIQRFRYVLRYVEKSYFYGNLVSMIIRFPIIPQLYRSSSLDDVSLVVKQGLAMHLLARIVGPSSRFQIEFQFGKRVALSRHEGLGAECLAPCGQDRFGWGPSHSRTSPLRRQSLSLFRSFRGIGISDHQPCKKSSEENESPGSTQRPYQGTVDAYVRPLYGPIWPDPKSQNVAAHPTLVADQPCIRSAIIIKERRRYR